MSNHPTAPYIDDNASSVDLFDLAACLALAGLLASDPNAALTSAENAEDAVRAADDLMEALGYHDTRKDRP